MCSAPSTRIPSSSLRRLTELRRLPVFVLAWITASAAVPVHAQVDLETIMRAPEWIGRSPSGPYWTTDSSTILFSRSTATVEEESGNVFDPRTSDLYGIEVSSAGATQWPLTSGQLRLIEGAELAATESTAQVLEPGGQRALYTRQGDLFLIPAPGSAGERLTSTTANESQPFFLSDGRVGFQRDGVVLARELTGRGTEEELFSVLGGQSPAARDQSEESQLGPLAKAERRLIDWVRDERARQLHADERRRLAAVAAASSRQPFHLGKGRALRRIVPSPNGRWALAVSVPEGPPPTGDQMPQFVTASGNVDVRKVRPKVGTAFSGPARLHLLDRASGLQHVIDLSELEAISDDPLAEIRAATAARREAAAPEAAGEESAPQPATAPSSDSEKPTEAAKPRDVDAGAILWSDRGDRVVFQLVSRDNKDRWIASVPLEDLATTSPATTGEEPWGRSAENPLKAYTLLHDRDPAWINWSFRQIQFLPRSSSELLVLSERSGWSQLYRLTIDTSARQGALERLTNGDFVTDSVQVDRAGQWAYFTANPTDAGVYEVHRVSLTEEDRTEQITNLGGTNDFSLSPDGTRLAVLHGRSNHPPELYLQAAEAGAEAQRLTRTVSESFLREDWVEPEFVSVPSSHVDRPIPARLFLPTPDAPTGDRPAVVFVHGAGYLQNAHQGWSGYFRETMFHTLLAQRGYVVLDIDYRGSKGYGRDWRTAIYRQMGTPEVEDLADAVAWLEREHGVDRQRVGVYGGSYGGFLTFMALFTEPDLFAAGAALRPVTDWAHYNHPYTSNILNTPEIDPEAYERSSPIEFAEGLQSPLLIASGMLDDNVFFQDSVRLVQRLIELEKENWEIAIYPVEPHGFREPSSWLDEYRRILALFERHLMPASQH